MSEESNNKKEPLWKIIAAIVPLILGSYVTYTYNEQQTKLNELTLMDKFKEQLVSEKTVERTYAYNVFDILGYRDLALNLIDANRDTAGGLAVVQKIQKDTAGAEKDKATAILLSLPTQIYMQIADDKQKTQAETIRTSLKRLDYSVPPIENVGATGATTSTEVRYFFEDDKKAADDIVKVLQSFVKIDAPKFVSGYEKTAKKGNVEIWLAK